MRGASDLAAFAQVDVCLRRRKPIRGASLHFNKAESVLFVSDEIDLGVYDCAAKITANRKREVSGDEAVAELFEICGGVLLA